MGVKVQIFSRKIIKPSTPTPNHLRTHKLSFFDLLQTPAHIPSVFFYQAAAAIDTVHQRLENSLSETLSRFYPLAGRLEKDGLTVDCHDQGAEYLEAQVNCQLAEFLAQEPLNIDLLHDFVLMDIGAPDSSTTPMVAVQVNVFECGGLALGIQVSHVVGDGFTGSTFIHEWATISRLGNIGDVIRPNFDLASFFPARDVPRTKPAPPLRTPEAKLVTRNFKIDVVMITSLRAKLMATASGGIIKRPPSRVEVVTALIWKALINITRSKRGKSRYSLVPFPLNLRGRTTLAIPDNSFGNYYVIVPVRYTMSDTNTTELHDLVGLLGDTIRNTLACFGKTNGSDDICSMVLKLRNQTLEDDYGVCCRFTTLCRFPLYEVDFGWGKPCWVSAVSVLPGQFALLDTKCGTGIEAQVYLNEIDMLQFERDPDIVELTSSSK